MPKTRPTKAGSKTTAARSKSPRHSEPKAKAKATKTRSRTTAASRPKAKAAAATRPSELEVLLRVTQRLTDHRPLEESLRLVTDAALELVPCNHASIRLLDASNLELLCGARSGDGLTTRPMTFRRSEGVLGWVVERRESACINDTSSDARFLRHPAPQGFDVRSILAEPLWSAGEVIGVLAVSSPECNTFRSEHQLLVRLLASCSTPPIERARLRRLALTDDLTLAYNQRYLTQRFSEELERSRRTGAALSVLLMDLDHFKRVNDQHGHGTGDAVLRIFADRVRALVRKIDIFIRRGGEEFLLVMPSTTREQARGTAERIRERMAQTPFEIGAGTTLIQTVSIGLATWDGQESPEQLQRRADAAMYSAKEQGRDQVVIAASERVSLLPASLPG